jgi:hypothetical protein
MELRHEDILEKVVDTKQLLVFAFADNEHTSGSENHKGDLALFQFILTLDAWVTTRIVTAFDVVFLFEYFIQLVAVNIIVTREVRVDQDNLLFFYQFK